MTPIPRHLVAHLSLTLSLGLAASQAGRAQSAGQEVNLSLLRVPTLSAEEEARRPIDVNELLDGIVLFIDKQMREMNIDIETRFERGIPKVMGSTNQLRQVLLNLIRNAREAMPQGGILSLETLMKDARVIIHIKDTGIGVPEEVRDKIFETFFTTKHEVKGVGLGLSVCYGIIKDHGGEIRVESEEGRGSTFSIILPTA